MTSLACYHPAELATFHRNGETAWCPVCERDVYLGLDTQDVIRYAREVSDQYRAEWRKRSEAAKLGWQRRRARGVPDV